MTEANDISIELAQGTKAELDAFGELVLYTTKDGIAMSIRAVIDRNPTMPETPGGVKAPGVMAHISVSTDPVSGVASPTIGFDTVKIKKRIGDVELNQILRIIELITQDAGMWQLKAVV